MAGDLHLAPDAADHALAVDQVGGALDAHVLPAVHALLDPDTVILGALAALVGAELKVEVVLPLELVMAGDRIARDAEHHRIDLLELRLLVAKATGLRSAAAGVVLRIEIEHHVLAL